MTGFFKSIKTYFLLLILLAPAALYAQSGFFWEQPAVFSQAHAHFPVTASNGDFGIVVWQEPMLGPEAGDASIGIALAVKLPGQPWENRGIIGGPYIYSDMEPSILSAVIDDRNRILIAAAASTAEIEILISEDMGRTFERFRLESGPESSLAPRISVASDGSYLLFISRGSGDSISIFFSRSADGRFWEPFRPFITVPGIHLNFLPSHASLRGRDYVVFQSFTASSKGINLFQLYVTISSDGGRTWSPPQLFTSFQDPHINAAAAADGFDNQRPHLSLQGDSLFLVWERRYHTGVPQIYAARLGPDGFIAGLPERVNSVTAHCNNPVAINFGGQTKIVWFDNRRGFNRIFMARRTGPWWEETELSRGSGDTFGRPVV